MSRTEFWRSVFGLLAMTALVCAEVHAQAPGDRGRDRGGRGGRPGGFDAMMLLRVDEVRKELELSNDQIDDLDEVAGKLNADRRERPEGEHERSRDRNLNEEERSKLRTEARARAAEEAKKVKAAISDILSPSQMNRLEEISLQVQGARALTTKEIAEKVGLSDEEMKSVEKAIHDGQEAMRAKLFRGRRPDGDFMAKIDAARKEVNNKVLETLTNEQRSKFEGLQGEKFELSMAALMRGRGGFGRGRGRPDRDRRRPDDGNEDGAPRRPERPERPESDDS